MRRVAIAILGIGLLLSQAGLALAADPPGSIALRSAVLVARGAGVSVTYDMVCEPLVGYDGTTLVYDAATDSMGTNARIRQAVSKQLIATGEGYPPDRTPVRCDGTTVNHLTVLATADTVPFAKGPAIVWLGANLYDPTYTAEGVFFSTQVVAKITR